MVSGPYEWRTSSNTHTGKVRSVNEDSILVKSDLLLWAVADGMGGHEAGDVASKMVVNSLEALTDCDYLSKFVDQVEDALLNVNAKILDLSANVYNGKTMGSTVVVMTVKGAVGICMWAGDSRLYRFRHGELKRISRDHSQVEEMLARGLISAEEAETHPASNIITRAVGAGRELYIDITAFEIETNDTFMLCSDGLYNEVAEEDIVTCLNMKHVEQSTTTLLNYALSSGARDNVSVVVSRAYPA